MKEKWTPHIIAVMAFVVFIVLGLACASEPPPSAPEIVYTEVPYSELWQKMAQVNSPGKGFIVEVYFNATNAPGEGSFSIGPNPVPNPKDSDRHWISGHDGRFRGYSGHYETYADNLHVEQYDAQTYKRIDKNKPYRIYISLHNVYSDKNRWTPIIDKIEGLMSLEEVAAIEANEKAKQEAAKEAERQASEQANRYDASKFTVVPSNFKPADYEKADLFDAVAASERLSSVPELFFGSYIYPSRKFVSDVLFVSQNGTDITFRTADNAIRKTMKVDSRTSLTAGQKVRIYYEVYRIKDWHIDAIERL